MELRQLRYFVAVAEEGHITHAAERLGIEQPSLSAQIKALETEMGVPLLKRHPRGVDLTPAGDALLERARAMLASADDTKEHLVRADKGIVGKLAVGSIAFIWHPLLSNAIRAFHRAYPLVALQLREANTPDLIKSAQTQLARINCYSGTATGQMNDATRSSLVRYLGVKKRPTSDTKVTEELVSELGKQAALTCPTICPAGHVAQGATCIAKAPPPKREPPPRTAKREEPRRETRREEPRREQRQQPQQQQQRQQASSSGNGGGRSGGATMIGVGF